MQLDPSRASAALHFFCRRNHHRLSFVFAAVICTFAAALGAASASAATFSNPASITINDAAPATPYPSNISVAGLGTSVADVNATLSGFSHTFPADVDVLLVGPQGQSVVPMSDVPRDDPFCGDDVVTAMLTFDDAAAGPIPPNAPLTSGTYQPTNNNTFVTNCAPAPDTDSFSGPAPPGPYGSTMSVFNATNPNGTWSLYVLDDGGGDSGSITGGWSLNIDAPAVTPPPPGTPPTCAGKAATIVGTDGKDTVKGTGGADVIATLGGNDKVTGLGGKDIVCGGDGRDVISGGGGKDKLLGQKGNDKLLGGGGADTLKGGPGKDNLVGGASHDKLVGGPGKDKVKQ